MRYYVAAVCGDKQDSPPDTATVDRVRRMMEYALREKGCPGIVEFQNPEWRLVTEEPYECYGWLLAASGDGPEEAAAERIADIVRRMEGRWS